MRGCRGIAVIALVASGCAKHNSFACGSDEQCGAGGRCEPVGFCSFTDASCGSGRRYDDYAGGGLAGDCVGDISPSDAGIDGAGIDDAGVDGTGDTPQPIPLVYVTTATELYTVDPISGAATLVGAYSGCTLGGDVDDVALNQAGEMYIIVGAPAGTTLFSVDRGTAACTMVGGIVNAVSSPIPNLVALAFVRTGGADELRVASGATPGKLYRIDGLTATDLGSFGGGRFARGDIAYRTGSGLLATLTDGTTQQLYDIDVVNNPVSIGTTARPYEGLATYGGDLYGFAADGKVARIDVTDGGDDGSNDGGHAWTGATSAPPPLM